MKQVMDLKRLLKIRKEMTIYCSNNVSCNGLIIYISYEDYSNILDATLYHDL